MQLPRDYCAPSCSARASHPAHAELWAAAATAAQVAWGTRARRRSSASPACQRRLRGEGAFPPPTALADWPAPGVTQAGPRGVGLGVSFFFFFPATAAAGSCSGGSGRRHQQQQQQVQSESPLGRAAALARARCTRGAADAGAASRAGRSGPGRQLARLRGAPGSGRAARGWHAVCGSPRFCGPGSTCSSPVGPSLQLPGCTALSFLFFCFCLF